MIAPTWLEVALVGFSSGVIGFVVKQVIANKIYVRKDMCKAKHEWLEKALTRIEEKIDTLNGGSN